MMRSAAILAAATTLAVLVTGTVLAAVPTNDTFDSRAVIGELPFVSQLDTSEATTGDDDIEANAECGAPATDASVWYEYTAADDGPIMVSAAGSSYSVGFIVLTGAPGAFTAQTCGPDQVAAYAAAGQPITIVAFDDQIDGTGNGGILELSVTPPPAPPTVELTIDPKGSFDATTGSAIVRGTVTCSGVGESGESKSFLDVQLSQVVGRIRISAGNGDSFACDGDTHTWAVELVSASGKFAGGKATVLVSSFSCGVYDCASSEVSATVTLRR